MEIHDGRARLQVSLGANHETPSLQDDWENIINKNLNTDPE